MPAARYWRLVGISTHAGGDLELAEIALFSGATRVDGTAVFSSTYPPVSANRWAASDVIRSNFSLDWDFGVDTNVDSVSFRSVTQATFLNQYQLQYLSSGLWVTYAYALSTIYQGDGVLQNTISSDTLFDKVTSLYLLTDSARANSGQAVGDQISGGSFTSYAGFNCLQANFSDVTLPVVQLAGDFCIEFFADGVNNANGDWFTLPSGYKIMGSGSNGFSLNIGVANASNTYVSPTSLRAIAGWAHYAWSRSGADNRFFIDGAQIGAVFTDSTIHAAGNVNLETNVGYFRGIRVTVGAARYTSNFTATFPVGRALNLNRTSFVSAPIRISEYTPPAQTQVLAAPRAATIDLAFGGTYRIVGTVRRQADPANLPLRRRVRLLNEKGTATVRETWSDETTGAFAFNDIAGPGRYVVVTYDHLNQYRALGADQVWSVPM